MHARPEAAATAPPASGDSLQILSAGKGREGCYYNAVAAAPSVPQGSAISGSDDVGTEAARCLSLADIEGEKRHAWRAGDVFLTSRQ